MKKIFTFLSLVALTGCVTNTGQQMSAEDLSRITPGQTTRAEMDSMFGDPQSVGMDAEGRTFAQYINLNLTTGPFVYSQKTQMLSVVYTNDVVYRFDMTDQLNAAKSASNP